MSGLTPAGFVIQTTEEILTAIETEEEATIDAAIDTAPDQPLGQVNGIHAAKVEEVWQAAQALYSAIDPANAEDQQLDVVCAITGTKRRPASSTRVVALCSLDKGHIFAAATLDANGNVTTNGDLVANVAGQPALVFTMIGLAIAGSTVVTLGPIDTTSASGTANYLLAFECTQTGPVACNAGTLTTIAVAKTGFNSITNSADAYSPGADIETDAALRLRRVVELVPPNGATNDAMRATLLAVKGGGADQQGVIQAYVFENDDDVADSNGLPPHSTLAAIWDGDSPQATDNDIAQAIWSCKSSGIKAWDGGTGTSGVAIDSAGAQHTIGFARVTKLSMYVNITVKIGPNYDLVNGDAALKALLATFGNTLVQGSTVYVEAFKAQAFAIAGVLTVTVFQVDSHASPTNTADIATTILQIPRFDTARITVSHA